jgi:hypothetical protein
LTAPGKLATVAFQHPCNDLHQRGLTGAILTHQQMNFAGLDVEVASAQRDYAAESFLDSIQLEKHPESS